MYPCYFNAPTGISQVAEHSPGKVQDNLHNVCGDTGTAHPLGLLAAGLDTSRPGDRILLAGFGQGCDVMGFTVTEGIRGFRPRRGVAGSLDARVELAGYLKYAKFRDLIAADLGIRGEANPNASLTALWRKRKMILGFQGAKCLRCGTPQFPAQPVCVNPDCGAYGQFEDYPFSDKSGSILMFTGDLLSPSVDPPAVYGLVGFEGGGRAFLDFTDCDMNRIRVGMPVTMSFRRRNRDQARGFTGYFWKAVPAAQG